MFVVMADSLCEYYVACCSVTDGRIFVIRDVLEVEHASVFRILVAIYVVSRDYRASERCPSSSVLKNTEVHNVSDTGCFSALR